MTEREKRERAIADKDYRRKGFFQDLWGLFVYSAAFSGLGLLILCGAFGEPDRRLAYLFFGVTLFFDIVVLRLYFKHPGQGGEIPLPKEGTEPEEDLEENPLTE
jgi:hypothetical protein